MTHEYSSTSRSFGFSLRKRTYKYIYVHQYIHPIIPLYMYTILRPKKALPLLAIQVYQCDSEAKLRALWHISSSYLIGRVWRFGERC